MFNIFQYLKLKGISMEQQKEYFEELDKANDRLNEFMLENPEKKLKDIKIEFPKNNEEKLMLDIIFES